MPLWWEILCNQVKMYKACIVAFLIISLNLSFLPYTIAYSSDDDEWTGEDKALHLTVSCAIDIFVYNFLKKNTDYTDGEAKITAFFTTLFAGFTKEFIDDRFSWKDIGADALGAGIGSAISIEF